MVAFDGVSLPRISVRAGFGGTTTPEPGVLVLGTGQLGTATLAGTTWADITADVTSISIARGRPSPIDSATPGTAAIVLDNTSGAYDPANTAGPYYNAGGAAAATNLLSADESGFEGGIGNWKIGTGGTAAQSGDVAHSGTKALKMTADGTSVLWALNDNNAQASAKAVTPGQLASVSAWVRAGGVDTTPSTHGNTVGSSACTGVAAITDVTGGVRQQQGIDTGQSSVDYNELVGFFTDTDEWLKLVNGTVPADKYRYVDVHWNIGPAAVAQIKAVHPHAKVLAYQNLGGMIAGPHTNGRPTTLVSQEEAVAHGVGADDWRLHTPAKTITASTNVTPPVFTTSAAHGLTTGDTVAITGHSVAAYNGSWVVASTPLTTTFTAAGMAAGGAGTGGTVAKVITFDTFTYLEASNPGRASFRTQASSHFASIRTDGFDGVFLDDTNMYPGHGFSTGDPGASSEYATDNAYRDAVTAAMAVITPAARAAGLLMVCNVGMNPWDSGHYAGYTTLLTANSLDGVCREFWTNFSGGALLTDVNWTPTMAVLTDAEAAGKFAMLNSYPTGTPNDTASIRYGLASFYLHTDGVKASGFGYNDGQPTSAYGQYRKLIGTPTAAKTLVSGTSTNGAWMRTFTGGIVCANAKSSGSVTFTLGGTYLDAGGLPVTSVTLAPAAGMVLLNQVSGPVSNVAAPSVQTDWGVVAGSYTSVRWTVRPDIDPSPAGYFWAGQSSFLPSPGGDVFYAGIQSGGNITSPAYSGKIAIFSVWNAVDAATSAVPGAWSGAFSGEGVGFSARIPYAWAAGRTYLVTVAADAARGAGWWACTVTDQATGIASAVGSIKAQGSAGLIFGGVSAFTEYFSNPGTFTSCDQIPNADTTFTTPVFSAGGTARGWRAVLRWLDSANAYVSQANGALVTDQAGAWTQVALDSQAVPTGVAKLIAQVETTATPAAGEVHYLDDVTLVVGGSLAGTPGVSGLDVGTPVWVRAEYQGVPSDRFFGFLADIQLDLGWDPTATLVCTDGLGTLGRAQLAASAPAFDNDWTGERIGHLADLAGWPTSKRALDQGQSQLGPTALGDFTLPLMQKAEQSEFGLLYVDSAGLLTFYDRYRTATAPRSTAVQATLTDAGGPTDAEMTGLVISLGRDLTFNDVHITREPIPGADPPDTPVEQVAGSAASQGRYGILSFPGQAGLLLRTDADALAMAQWLSSRFAVPQIRISEVSVDATTQGLWAVLLPLTLLDRIYVSRDYGPSTIAMALLIQSHQEEIRADPASWAFTWATSATVTPPNQWVLGTSALGAGVLGF